MLTKEQILDAAEEVLRKFGPRKTTVVDVARALDVSHGTVYRHFESKAALHEAITMRWIDRVIQPLSEISTRNSDPKIRLKEWFQTLMDIKKHKVKDDPEMFASYSILAQKVPQHLVLDHLNIMIKQVEVILINGVDAGVFDIENCAVTARSLFDATLRYHHPLHVNEWQDENIQQEFDQLFSLLERAILKV